MHAGGSPQPYDTYAIALQKTCSRRIIYERVARMFRSPRPISFRHLHKRANLRPLRHNHQNSTNRTGCWLQGQQAPMAWIQKSKQGKDCEWKWSVSIWRWEKNAPPAYARVGRRKSSVTPTRGTKGVFGWAWPLPWWLRVSLSVFLGAISWWSRRTPAKKTKRK